MKGNGKQRVLNMVDFFRNVKGAARAYAKAWGKPDVIYASSVHPLTLVAGLQMAKHFGVPCMCEVRDLWPESIVAYSTRFTRDHPLIRLLYRGEKWIYQRADALILPWRAAMTISRSEAGSGRSPGPRSTASTTAWTWSSSGAPGPLPGGRCRPAGPALFKVVYIGSIRRVNQLGALLDAARQVTDPTVRFLVWGDGDQRAALERRCRRKASRM